MTDAQLESIVREALPTLKYPAKLALKKQLRYTNGGM